MDKSDENLRVIAVIPAYNEESTIEKVVGEVKASVSGIDVVVVDDGSSDDTYHCALKSGAKVVRHPFNMGIGATVQTGFKFAAKRNYDVAIQVDGDGQHNPSYIPEMLKILKNSDADVVGGSRFLEKKGFQSSLLRRMGIKFFELIFKILVGIDVTDCTSGFRAFGKDALYFVAKNYPEDYPEPEAVILLKKAGFKFVEIPVVMRERQGGSTSIKGFKPFHYMVKVTLALLMNIIRKVER
ncbi:glycosyltransferase family 2 protein [bacterium]|nr:glycosyltransferase family 2 protein [bacterium]